MEKLPEGWEKRRLGDVSSVIMGQSPSSSLINKEGKGLPFLQGNAEFTSKYPNPTSWIEKPLKTSGKGSILVSVRAPIGDLNFANSQCCIGRGLASIEANGFIVDNIFLWYSIHYFINELIKIGQGSTFDAIGRNELRNLCISLPPLPEQHKIADILETADKAIEKTDVIIEKYRRIKQGLMQDLLTKGIDENGQIRNEDTHKFKDSPLGRIPEEWEVAKLGNQIYLNPDRLTCSKNVLINYIDIESVVDNKIQVIKSLKIEDAPSRAQRIVKCNDIIVSTVRPNLKAFAFISPKYDNYVCSTGFSVLRAKKDTHPLFLFYLVLYDMIFLKQVLPLIVGSNYPAINCSVLLNLHIPLPPLPEQHRIASILSQIDEVIEKEERYKEKLERIKQGLMQDLLTGKVRVNHLIKET